MFKFLSILMNLAATSSGLLLMGASAWLITTASFQPPLSALAVGVTIVRAAGLFRAIFRYADRYFTHTAIFEELTKIRLRFYKMAMSKFPLKSGATGEGELLHDLTVSADILKDFFPRVVQPLLCTVIVTIIVNIYLFRTIGTSSLLLISSLIVTLIVSYIFNNNCVVDDTKYREMLLDFNDGIEELSIGGSCQTAVDKLNLQANILNIDEQKNRSKIANVDTLCNLINAAAMIIIFSELAASVDIIELAIWLFILLSIFELFNTLPSVVKSFINSQLSITNSAFCILNSELSITHYALHITNLSFGYDSSIKVLDNLNLEVEHGDKIAIIGESGSGKTTLLYLLLRLWTPDSGEILINGSISAATTNNYIFSSSIRDNFKLLKPEITQEEILNVLRICQLEELDIDRNIGENGSKISGGERCRLQTALALAADSDILIFDEPTAGLDKNTANILINEIINYVNKKNRTLIIITHDFSVAKMMKKIYKLSNGKIKLTLQNLD